MDASTVVFLYLLRMDKVRHLHCCHLHAFFVWRVRAKWDRFIGLLEMTFLGDASELVLVNTRPDDSSSSMGFRFVCWVTLLFTAFRFLITSSLDSVVCFGIFCLVRALDDSSIFLWRRAWGRVSGALQQVLVRHRRIVARASYSALISIIVVLDVFGLALGPTSAFSHLQNTYGWHCLGLQTRLFDKILIQATWHKCVFQGVASDMIRVLTESNLYVLIPWGGSRPYSVGQFPYIVRAQLALMIDCWDSVWCTISICSVSFALV